MHDVQIGKAQPVEFGNQITIKIRPFGALVDAPHRKAGRKPDGGAVRADLLGDGRGYLDRKPRPVLD
ncbi:hypothetical protein D9M72_571550 [compost metagenome]